MSRLRAVVAAAARSRGYSLVELMVSLAMLSVVLVGASFLLMGGNTAALTTANRAEVQQSSRVALLMQEDLRLIGYGVPPTQIPITAATATSITFWGDLRDATTTLTADANAGDTTLSVAATAGIATGDTVYLVNGATTQGLAVSTVGAGTITVSAPGVAAFMPRGAQVGAPKTVTYALVGTTLTKDAGQGAGPLTIATGVQSFQISYYDQNDALIAAGNLSSSLAAIRRLSVALTIGSALNLDAGVFTAVADARPRNL
jgi:prepilin-type N-terminal cleavage/methylation domain-containing protein